LKLNLLAIAVIALTALTLAVGCGVLGNPNPCDRTQAVRNALERETRRDCDLISDDDMADIRLFRLRLFDHDVDYLKKSDFASLTNLQNLYLFGDDLSELPPDVFDSLDNLQHLNLGGNSLSELSPGVFDGLDNLQWMGLRDNNLSELPPGVFDGLDNRACLTAWTTCNGWACGTTT
jgi:Leucine-rich repeat (LRR) protein